MLTFPAGVWIPVDNAFIRGECVPDGLAQWQGHVRHSWEESGRYIRHNRVRLSTLAPSCEGEAIITSVTSASEVITGETGVWIDFHGVGTLTVNGEAVAFIEATPG